MKEEISKAYEAGYGNGYAHATEDVIKWLIEHINDYLTHGRDIDLMFDDIRDAIKSK